MFLYLFRILLTGIRQALYFLQHLPVLYSVYFSGFVTYKAGQLYQLPRFDFNLQRLIKF